MDADARLHAASEADCRRRRSLARAAKKLTSSNRRVILSLSGVALPRHPLAQSARLTWRVFRMSHVRTGLALLGAAALCVILPGTLKPADEANINKAIEH